MTKHARLSPSASSRWLTCTASVAATEAVEERFGKEEPGIYAETGTCKHEASEMCIDQDLDPEDVVGMTFNDIVFETDMIDDIAEYVELAKKARVDADLFELEQKVVVIEDEVFGTADLVVIKGNTLYVYDLKTGFHKVYATDNTQLLLYALGAWLMYADVFDIEHIVMAISQPRCDHYDEERVDVKTIKQFFKRVTGAMVDIRKGGTFQPSDKGCEYCRARGTCPALTEFVQKEAQQDFNEMAHHELVRAWEGIPMLEHYIAGVKAALMEHLEKGEQVPGVKLVEGRRGAKSWVSEAAAIRYFSRRIPKFKANAYVQKLKTPTQLLKVVKMFEKEGQLNAKVTPKKLGELIESKPGKPTIAPSDDKRREIVYGQSAAADFKDVVVPTDDA